MIPTDDSLQASLNQGIIAQAKNGSIAAIIQLLNESLSHLKVRTRAVLEQRSLLLLCEADHEEYLDREVIIPHVQKVLEAIAPPNIRKVQFFSRLTQSQQVLWTTEIAHNTQVLWMDQITLKRPSLLQQLQSQLNASRAASPAQTFRPVSLPSQEKPIWPELLRWSLGGLVGLTVVAIAVRQITTTLRLFSASSPTPSLPAPSPTASPTSSPAPTPEAAPDPFVQAVRLAEQAALAGQNAQSRTEWLDLAYRWQQASDLMAEVPPEDDRYQTAQDRVDAYRANSEAALNNANQL